MTYHIRKSSGEKQPFDLEKFRRSLRKAGASEKVADQISQAILQKRPKSTKKIHEITADLLKETSPALAGRYNLKRALLDLGPEGFLFEQFIARLLELEGFTTETNVVIPGICVDHEVDVLAHRQNEHCLVECKFHNRPGAKTDVVITLYMQARFQDLQDAAIKHVAHAQTLHTVLVATNTKFTRQAVQYGTCKNMRLLSWDYPEQHSLAQLIERHKLYPITTLASLNNYQKRIFLRSGFVLCKDAPKQRKLLQELKLGSREIDAIIKEAQAVCKL